MKVIFSALLGLSLATVPALAQNTGPGSPSNTPTSQGPGSQPSAGATTTLTPPADNTGTSAPATGSGTGGTGAGGTSGSSNEPLRTNPVAPPSGRDGATGK